MLTTLLRTSPFTRCWFYKVFFAFKYSPALCKRAVLCWLLAFCRCLFWLLQNILEVRYGPLKRWFWFGSRNHNEITNWLHQSIVLNLDYSYIFHMWRPANSRVNCWYATLLWQIHVRPRCVDVFLDLLWLSDFIFVITNHTGLAGGTLRLCFRACSHICSVWTVHRLHKCLSHMT